MTDFMDMFPSGRVEHIGVNDECSKWISAVIIDKDMTEGGATLVALHGFLDNICSFAPIVEHLSRETPVSKIILMDLPGHGVPSTPTGGSIRSLTTPSMSSLPWIP